MTAISSEMSSRFNRNFVAASRGTRGKFTDLCAVTQSVQNIQKIN